LPLFTILFGSLATAFQKIMLRTIPYAGGISIETEVRDVDRRRIQLLFQDVLFMLRQVSIAIAAGAALPLFTILFGSLATAFQKIMLRTIPYE
jgi:hypothetical protein